MTPPRLDTVQCISPAGLHRMAYAEWGEAANPRVLVCVHGLTRCGRDFDALAAALSGAYRVVCPDIAGRGQSDWLADKAHYTVPQYVNDLVTLLARLNVPQVDWLGTSMGGIIGMALAAQQNTPVRRLILNDVGPVITAASLVRIGQHLGNAPRFDSLAAAVAYAKNINASFGNLSDAQWRALTAPTLRRAADGKIEFRYDPGIAFVYQQAMASEGEVKDMEFWPLYEAIRCPTLALRGECSDLLTPQTHAQMAERGPRAQLEVAPAVGHAPMFQDATQISLVRDFLAA